MELNTHKAHTSHGNTIYYKIFAALLVLTVLTVALNRLDVGITLAITLALLVAATKASLVASFFMHLIAEKKMIYVVLIFTGIFFVAMMGLTIGMYFNTPEGTEYLNKQYGGTPIGHHEVLDDHTDDAHH